MHVAQTLSYLIEEDTCYRACRYALGGSMISELYRPSFSLLTDLYQLTMAYGYWKAGMANRETVFHLFFRKTPFKGGYAIAAGLEQAIELIENSRFREEDCAYLRTLTGNDHKPLFEEGFLQYLLSEEYAINIDAVPEGSLVFAHEPLLRVSGNIIPCQLLETALLTCMNFQTLIATKASRMAERTKGQPLLEFGLRRAQGFDGGITASRAAFIGGSTATSNVLASRLLGIPVKGTHAHSWVMMFDTEEEAFAQYAAAMPNNCVFLVDTYNTIQGVRNAITEATKMRSKGYEVIGIRLDSGDLASLSIQARELLDQEGFESIKIIASDSLDEWRIEELNAQGAKIDIWGIGTNLVTAKDQPALGGVYKLACVTDKNGVWQNRIKRSDSAIKTSNPGMLQCRRFYDSEGKLLADMLYDIRTEPSLNMRELNAEATQHLFSESHSFEDLLEPVLRAGKRVIDLPSLQECQEFAKLELSKLPSRLKELQVSEQYPVGLEQDLYQQKQLLLKDIR